MDLPRSQEDPAGQALQTAYSSWQKWFIQRHSLENDTHAVATAAGIQLCTPACSCLCTAHLQACIQPLRLPRSKGTAQRLGDATHSTTLGAILQPYSPQSKAVLWVQIEVSLWSILLRHLVYCRFDLFAPFP